MLGAWIAGIFRALSASWADIVSLRQGLVMLYITYEESKGGGAGGGGGDFLDFSSL